MLGIFPGQDVPFMYIIASNMTNKRRQSSVLKGCDEPQSLTQSQYQSSGEYESWWWWGGEYKPAERPLSSIQRCTDKRRQCTPLNTDNEERSLSDELASKHTPSHTHTHTYILPCQPVCVRHIHMCVCSQPSLWLPDRKYGSKLHVSTSLIPPAEQNSCFLVSLSRTKAFWVFFVEVVFVRGTGYCRYILTSTHARPCFYSAKRCF